MRKSGAILTVIVLISVSIGSCKAPKRVIVQEKIVTRDSIIVLLRDTTIYVEIERVVNSDAKPIKDTIFLENKYSYAYSYVVDSILFMQLVQKQQELEFKLQYTDKERYSERDSITIQTLIQEVNRLTRAQSFWIVCGQIALAIFAIFFVISMIKLYIKK